ncbi:TatD family hydrolase [Acerihabitans arboris]|uniref:Metal-dependent hydrolase n=1 Tax=Acerihabitans arboris TaxID=2691583 RepID=A0A845S9G6_9GAMM|nr:TatD family hydrolase [Acerihabitans arboris]NDL61370.1 metal-dependent hydrolase [Acerihabitans arboris]
MVKPVFIDTHCHFDFPPFSGCETDSIVLAAEAGVRRIIVPAVEAGRFATVLSLADRHPALYAALGMHPIAISRHTDAGLALLAHYLRQQPARLVAVGEIGLDNYMDEPLLERQKALLVAQLGLAVRHDLPVILHSRRTHDLLAQILRRHQVPRTGVVHGFAGSYEQAVAFIKLGYYIGVGGTITYARANKTRRVMARLPLNRLLLETDAPDMPLAGFQGQPNRPERLGVTFASLCELRPEPPEQIAEIIYRNTLDLFGLTCQ